MMRDALALFGYIADVEAGLTRPFGRCLADLDEALRAVGYVGGPLRAIATRRGLDNVFYDSARFGRDDFGSILSELEHAYGIESS